MTTKKEDLEFLIESLENLEKKGCLSGNGMQYLRGLRVAYDILFPMEIMGGG